MIPWKYHQPTPRDIAGELLRIWNQRLQQSGASVTLASTWIVPDDRIAVISSWHAQLLPGTATNTEGATFEIRRTADAQSTMFRQYHMLQTTAASGMGREVYVLAPPKANIVITSHFSSGAFTNITHQSIAAVLIPRGQISGF